MPIDCIACAQSAIVHSYNITSVPPLATLIVCPEDTVTGPTILAFSLAAIESPPVNVCTFLYAPLILVSLAAVTVASVGAPHQKYHQR